MTRQSHKTHSRNTRSSLNKFSTAQVTPKKSSLITGGGFLKSPQPSKLKSATPDPHPAVVSDQEAKHFLNKFKYSLLNPIEYSPTSKT